VSTLLYITLDAVAAASYPGYSYIDDTISELTAVDAPTRAMWGLVGGLYSILLTAGAFGVWQAGRGRWRVRAVGGIVIGLAIMGLVTWPFVAINQREVIAANGPSSTDTLHGILVAIDVLGFFACIGLGATAFGRKFRVYSIVTIVVLIVFGTFSSAQTEKIERNEPTPLLGVGERIAIFGAMAWFSALTTGLIVQERESRREQDVAEALTQPQSTPGGG
jgi:hypothetical protein